MTKTVPPSDLVAASDFAALRRREDLLVSIGFAEISNTAHDFDMVRRVANMLAARFRYWEILVVAEASEALDMDPLFQTVANLRLLRVRSGSSIYRRRVATAAEAIGDVVLLTSPSEAAVLDLIEMIERAFAKTSIVVGLRDDPSLLDPVIRMLGTASGFRVSAREMQTAAYPRTLLNLLLAHPDRELTLRFVPRDVAMPVIGMATAGGIHPRTLRGTRRRFSLIQKLVVNGSPLVLGYVSILSSLIFLAGGLYLLYALGAWVILEDLQPGWLTTSVMLSMTAAFLGAAMFGLSSGLQKVIDLVSPDLSLDVLDERSSVDLFSDVMTELNIDFDPDDGEAVPPPPATVRKVG